MDCNEWEIMIGHLVDMCMCVHFIFIGGKIRWIIWSFSLFRLSVNVGVFVYKRQKVEQNMKNRRREKKYCAIVRCILQMKDRPLLLPLIWFRQDSNKYARSVLFCFVLFSTFSSSFQCIFIRKHSAVHFVLLIFLCFFFFRDDECVHEQQQPINIPMGVYQ